MKFWLILTFVFASAQASDLNPVAKSILSDLGIQEGSAFGDRLRAEIVHDSGFQTLANQGKTPEAQKYVSAILEQNFQQALENKVLDVERLAAMNEFLKKRHGVVDAKKPVWWKPKTWFRPAVPAFQVELKKQMTEEFLAHPEKFQNLSPIETSATVDFAAVKKRLKLLSPEARIAFYGRTLSRAGQNQLVFQQLSGHLDQVIRSPLAYEQDLLQWVRQYNSNWDPRVVFKMADAIETLEKTRVKQSERTLNHITKLINDYSQSDRFLLKYILHRELNHDNVVLLKQLLYEHAQPQMDLIYEVLADQSIDLKPGTTEPLSREVLNFIEKNGHTGGADAQKIGPWLFSKLIKENPLLAKEIAPQYLDSFLVHAFGDLKNQVVPVLRWSKSPELIESFKSVLRYARETHHPGLKEYIKKTSVGLPSRIRSAHLYADLKDEVAKILGPDSFENQRLLFLENEKNAIANVQKYLSFLEGDVELLLRELTEPKVIAVLSSPDFPQLFKNNPEFPRRLVQKLISVLPRVESGRGHLLVSTVLDNLLTHVTDPKSVHQVLDFYRTGTHDTQLTEALMEQMEIRAQLRLEALGIGKTQSVSSAHFPIVQEGVHRGMLETCSLKDFLLNHLYLQQ